MRSKELKLFFMDLIIILIVKRAPFKNQQGGGCGKYTYQYQGR